jgi:ribonucleoside-diphosphate reductase alpha chain
MAQVRMLAAVQPFISGSISKSVGLADDAPVSEVKDVIVQAWKLGLKAISFYRNNSKMSQPLVNAVLEKERKEEEESGPKRRRMADEVDAKIHRGVIAPHTPWETKLYIIPGEWDDGSLGESFVTIAKEGSALRGLVDALMTAVSIGLQYGVPLPVFCEKFIGTKFEPHGRTASEKIRFTTSIVDYIFKYLGSRYLDMHFNELPPPGEDEDVDLEDVPQLEPPAKAPKRPTTFNTFDLCECGGMLYMSGVCKRCSNPLCKRNMQGACGG